jgi:hypothetical protein
MNELSDTPSELIMQTMDDFELIENDPLYSINMGTWHWPEDHACEVCFAGACMVKSLDADITFDIEPDEYSSSVEGKLNALDSFRAGYISSALAHLNKVYPKDFLDEDGDEYFRIPITDYKDDPVKFKSDMWALVVLLQLVGL